ncbi:5'-methylthioadenosine/adenosylhomocysteine nucleosidase [Glaciecola sp. 1036]|uniref:5'-methylthioadenosine/adenosylhomocysteine nucleosidase n=1 Tax=Alteromonadaceae TaxID=72275 RepID=UPI003D014FA1
MKIAIIGAMQEEVALLKSQLANPQPQDLFDFDLVSGDYGKHQVLLIQSGIGKVASSVACALIIQKFAPDLVINTGSAGGFDPDLNVGDVVIADALVHHDVDVTHFGYALGQVPSMPAQYVTQAEISQLAFNAANDLPDIKVKTGLICSGDSFIGSDEQALLIKEKFPAMKAVEMEGAAIAQCCHMLNTPIVVIRSLSDIAGKTSTVSFEQYLEKAAKNSATLVMKMLEKIEA